MLDDVVSPQPTNVSHGNAVLGQIFGSKDVSRAVAQDASTKSGLDASVLKKMLPMLAMVVAGYMAKQSAAPDANAQPAQDGGGRYVALNVSRTGRRPERSSPASATPRIACCRRESSSLEIRGSRCAAA
jgi:hypothetical protein